MKDRNWHRRQAEYYHQCHVTALDHGRMYAAQHFAVQRDYHHLEADVAGRTYLAVYAIAGLVAAATGAALMYWWR